MATLGVFCLQTFSTKTMLGFSLPTLILAFVDIFCTPRCPSGDVSLLLRSGSEKISEDKKDE